MTLNEATELVYSTFVTAWGSTTLFTFDNEDFEEPESDPWVRLVVRSTTGGQDSLGEPGFRIFRRRAMVMAQVFTPANSGSQQGQQLAHQLRDVFEARAIGGLDFNDGQVTTIGPSGRWYQTNVTVAFGYNEVK